MPARKYKTGGIRKSAPRRKLGASSSNYARYARTAVGVAGAMGAFRGGPAPSLPQGRRITTRGATGTRTKRKSKTKNTRGGYGEVTTMRMRHGRRKRLTVAKLQRLTMTTAVLRFQGLKRYGLFADAAIDEGPNEAAGVGNDLTKDQVALTGGCPGYFILKNGTAVDTINVTGDTYPMHVYNLTRVPNLVTTATVGREMIISNSTTAGVGDFLASTVLVGQSPTGAPSGVWWMESMSPSGTNDTTTNNIQPIMRSKYVKTEWFDIRMICYGQRQMATFYDIMLVRFDDSTLIPDIGITEITNLDTQRRNARNALYQTLVRNITFNPILPGASNAVRGMKVMKRQRFLLPASMSDETDRTPAHKIVKFFYKDETIRNHEWGVRSVAPATNVDGPNFAQNLRANDMSDDPHPKARVFLLVRASNTMVDAAVDEDMDGLPSYDIVIRKKIRYEPGQETV